MEIQSIHQARLLVALEGAAQNPSRHFGVWLTTMELAEAAKIGRRTATQWLSRMLDAGITLKESVFPGPLWSLNDTPETEALLQKAQDALAKREPPPDVPGQLRKTRRFGLQSFVE